MDRKDHREHQVHWAHKVCADREDLQDHRVKRVDPERRADRASVEGLDLLERGVNPGLQENRVYPDLRATAALVDLLVNQAHQEPLALLVDQVLMA